MSDESVILINLLKVNPGKQDALIALLKQNTDRVVRTLHGWKATRLIAADGRRGCRHLFRVGDPRSPRGDAQRSAHEKPISRRSLSWRAWTRSWARRC